MKIAMIGAGAMGGSFGGFLSRAGNDVTLVDTWDEHVARINANGLRIEGARDEHVIEVPAVTSYQGPPVDLAIVFVDSNSTAEAARTLDALLAPDGFAVTFQNGIGNVEALVAALGAERVVGGSSMCSAASRGPGHVALTHLGPNSIGELDGSETARLGKLEKTLAGAGFEMVVSTDVQAKIWNKLVVNVGINAICATTGLRMGEVARLPELDAFQDRVVAEALQVVAAKGLKLPDKDVAGTIKSQCQLKFSKPSMLQHIEAGRKTEIDAINGALVREGTALGIQMPYNESLVALLKGRELKRQREVNDPDLDYEAWERSVQSSG